MTSTNLICLTGPAGAGKDTIADYLVWQHGFTKLSLATPIKRALNAMIPELSVDHWQDRDLKESPLESLGISPRVLSQTLGTEWGRQLDPDIWIKMLWSEVQTIPGSVVIADVRFDNEAEFFRDRGGVVWRVYREIPKVAPHSSEAGISDALIDHVVDNSGAIVSMLRSVEHKYCG